MRPALWTLAFLLVLTACTSPESPPAGRRTGDQNVDSAVTFRPQRVERGASVKLRVHDNPPGAWGLHWWLYRLEGSSWVQAGGLLAGPGFDPGSWFLGDEWPVGAPELGWESGRSIDLKVPHRLEPGKYRAAMDFHEYIGENKTTERHYASFEVETPS